MSFLWKCICSKNDDETIVSGEDVLIFKGSSDAAETGIWFPRAFSRSSVLGNDNTSLSLDKAHQSRAENRLSLRQRALSMLRRSSHTSTTNALTLEGVSPRSFTIKVSIEEENHSFAKMSLILEAVPVCRKCDNIFDDINEVLITLIRDKITKVLVVTMDGQQECHGCSICKEALCDENSLRNHLLKHIESKEVLCEQCETSEKDSQEPTDNDIKLYDKDLEKLRMSRIVINCKQCDSTILSVPFMLPEIVTIKNVSSDDLTAIEPNKCEQCKCNLSPILNETRDRHKSFSFYNVLCDNCMKSLTNKITEYAEHTNDASTEEEYAEHTNDASTEEDSLDSERLFGVVLPIPRRRIILTSRDIPLLLEPEDFVIQDSGNEMDTAWYTCRFCGSTAVDKEFVISHARNHVSVKEDVCEKCQVQAH